MKTYARIDDGKVVEIIEPLVLDFPVTVTDDASVSTEKREVPIDERFHPEIVAMLVNVTEVNPAPKQGDAYVDGEFIPYMQPIESQQETLDRAIADVRRQRAPILDALAGIIVDAMIGNDSVTIEAAGQARTDLRDITSLPALLAASSYEAMKAVVMTRYREIAEAAPENVQKAFREVFA